MTTPDRSSSSPPSAHVAPDDASRIPPEPSPRARRLRSWFETGALILLSLGAIILFLDWQAGSQFTRPWLQVGFAILGALAIGGAIFLPKISRLRRVMISVGGLLIVLTVLDSLDGQQDILTDTVLLLALWALAFAYTSAQLLQLGTPMTARRKVAIGVGILATLTYLGSACYYVVVNLTVAPLNVDHHPLFGFALPLNVLLQWIGELGPKGGPLTGAVRICPACGLRNIRERQTCNRCAAQLGPVEHVV